MEPLGRGSRGRQILAGAKVWVYVAIVLVVGFAGTAGAFLAANEAEERRVVKGLELRSEWRAKDLQAKLNLARRALLTTVIYAENEPPTDVAKFYRVTTEAAASSPSIVSIGWAIPVTRAGRAHFEASVGFPIVANGTGAKRIAEADRADYLPIIVQKRFDGRPSSRGFDLASEPRNRRAMESARDSGLPKAAKITDASSAVGNPRDVILWPLFDIGRGAGTVTERRAYLKGYIVGVFLIVDTLYDAIADTPEIPETLIFYLSDVTGGDSPDRSFRMVALYSPKVRTIRATHVVPSIPAVEYSSTRSFDVTGQRWRVTALYSHDAVAAERSVGPLAILVVGSLLTIVLAGLAVAGARRVSVVRNLVRQRTAELRQTNIKLSALIEASPFAIVCLDADHKVSIWNASAEQLFGYKEQQVVGQPYPLVPPEERAKFEDRIKHLEAGEVWRNLAVHRRHLDGTSIDVSSTAAPFYDAANVLLGVILFIEDRRAQMKAQLQLRQAQKLEAIGLLTGGVAHDFNNLLAIIQGNLELLADRKDTAPVAAEMIDDALRAAKRGAALTHGLLAYSSQQQLAPSAVDVGVLVTGLVRVLLRVFDESIVIDTDIAPGLRMPLIDPEQLENALLNIAINARDAMPDGGRLTIAAENSVMTAEESQAYPELAVGEWVLLAISDTGTGMTKDVLERAFEPFFTTKPVGSGSGLGLSMVYGFIKQSGGHMTIVSEPGFGTTVKLYLLESKKASSAAPVMPAIPPWAGSRGRVILVVEDDSAVRTLQLRVLVSLGYQTLEAVDGSAGLATLRSAARVDLMLTDIVLPGGMSGPALAEAALAISPGLKVLFMSGHAPATVTHRYNLLGADLLSKPFSRATLANAIQRLLEGQLVR